MWCTEMSRKSCLSQFVFLKLPSTPGCLMFFIYCGLNSGMHEENSTNSADLSIFLLSDVSVKVHTAKTSYFHKDQQPHANSSKHSTPFSAPLPPPFQQLIILPTVTQKGLKLLSQREFCSPFLVC